MTSLTSLSQPELDVMQHLVQSRTTNVVVLAADMWRTTPDWQAFDPYPLIVYVLDSLSSRGLVTFRVNKPWAGGGRVFDMPFDIRLTPKGWDLMGYGHKTVEVGSMGRHQREPLHPGDMTDYLNLHSTAIGGAIEVETFAEHRARFTDHTHMYGVELTMANLSTAAKRTRLQADPRIMSATNEAGERGYIRITPDMEAEVISTRDRLGAVGYADIAQETGLPERTIKYILVDLPRLRRVKAGEDEANGSLKGRIYEAVKVLGTIKDVAEVRRIVGMADSDHDVMHVLHSLHTQGRIDFDERGNGMGTATVVNIRLPKKAAKRVSRETYDSLPEIVQDRLPEVLGPEATTPDATPASAPSAPEPTEAYPLLDALLDRERKRLDNDSKGMAYVTAAEAIKDIDPDEAVRMMRKAEALDVPFPSPIEREYLMYVAAHPYKETPNE
jgi:hypothetical protein